MTNAKQTKIRHSLLLASLLVFMLAITACTTNSISNNTSNNIPTTTGSNPLVNSTAPPDTSKVKLVDSPNGKFAFLISGDTINSDAKAALAGFNLDKTSNADGTTIIKLTSTNTEYVDQTYTLKNGEQLYFIERSMGDDSNNQEFNLGDDTAVIVDSEGYIVNP